MAVPISNVTRRVVFAPSGTGPYAFTFEILAATDIEVYKGDTLLTLTTDYSVTINANGTGSVTLVLTAGTDNITIVGARAIQRLSDFVTGGDFFANTVNSELDSLTIFAQQNAEAVTRSIQAPVTDPTTIDMTLPVKADRAGKYLSFDTDGNPEVVNNVVDVTTVAAIAGDITAVSAIDSEVSTLAGIAGNIETLAPIAGNITTVAGVSSSIPTVAGIDTEIAAVAANAGNIDIVAGLSTEIAALGPIAADITAVAAVDTDVTTLAAVDSDIAALGPIAANITTVATNIASVNEAAGNIDEIIAVANDLNEAVSEIEVVANNIALIEQVGGNIDNITIVAGNIDSVNTVATNIEDVTNFADVYQGPKSSDPSTRNDLSALQAGDLYFDTVNDVMKVYDGAAWVAAYASLAGALVAANNLSDLTDVPTARQNLDLEVGVDVGYLNIPLVADKTAAYTLATGDVGKVVGVGSGGSIEIPDATFAAGDAVLVFNNTSGDVTITCTITTAYIAGADADVASVTLSTRGVANILFLSGTACVLTGNIA